jgi:hypothetical protein
MIRRLDVGSGNVLGWEVTGKVTEEKVRTLSEEFQEAIAEHGKVRVLVRMRRIPRMGLGAWVEDFKLVPYEKVVERYAIVSDSNLFEWTSKIAEAFIGGEVRRFEARDTRRRGAGSGPEVEVPPGLLLGTLDPIQRLPRG